MLIFPTIDSIRKTILNDLLLSVRIYFRKEENRVNRVYRVTIYKVYKVFIPKNHKRLHLIGRYKKFHDSIGCFRIKLVKDWSGAQPSLLS